MINIIIADDEKHARERLKNLLSEYNLFNIIGEAKNGDDVIQLIMTKSPDAAFLDINMPGVSVFQSIPSLKNPPLIIFQTAYSEYAVDAFGINAVDYILKPINKSRLDKAVEKLKIKFDKKNCEDEPDSKIVKNDSHIKDKKEINQISVKINSAIKVIPVKDIYKISYEEGFSFIYTHEGRFLSDKYLNYFDDLLLNSGFFRVSRTDIINTNYISTIHPMFKGSYIVELTNSDKIKLSRRRAKDLKNLISF